MGLASRLAAVTGKIACDVCRKPFGEGRRVASFSDEPLEAVCEYCDLARAFHREYTYTDRGKIARRSSICARAGDGK